MLLKSELDGWNVAFGTGESIGRLKDLIVDARGPHWKVKGLILARGITRSPHFFDVPTSGIEIDRAARTLVRRGHAPLRKETSSASALDRLRLSSLVGARVHSSDDELIGTAYDFAIATRPEGGWLVWRFLVKVPGARSRRLRLPVSDIGSLAKGRIVLTATKEDLRAA